MSTCHRFQFRLGFCPCRPGTSRAAFPQNFVCVSRTPWLGPQAPESRASISIRVVIAAATRRESSMQVQAARGSSAMAQPRAYDKTRLCRYFARGRCVHGQDRRSMQRVGTSTCPHPTARVSPCLERERVRIWSLGGAGGGRRASMHHGSAECLRSGRRIAPTQEVGALGWHGRDSHAVRCSCRLALLLVCHGSL